MTKTIGETNLGLVLSLKFIKILMTKMKNTNHDLLILLILILILFYLHNFTIWMINWYHEYSCTLILLSYLLAAMKGPETSPIMLALVTVAQIIRRNPATSGPVSQSPVEKMPM